MMGLPFLRTDGAFFASYDTRTGRLLVKLPASKVQELFADGTAEPFAPAGRTFREWAAVPAGMLDDWTSLLAEAFDFVSGLPAAPSSPRPRGGPASADLGDTRPAASPITSSRCC